ncbi:MAG: NAD(P)H-hydrate dehydratase [Clostridia bacterium]|nr:NAD(P)H-hydrate dehydratase [Clostridia bacterium]
MDLVTNRQMQAADSYAIKKLGIPERVLMDNAAEALVKAVLSRKEVKGCKIAVFCGPGNNGGDGWAAALKLSVQGALITVYAKDIPFTENSAGYYADKAIRAGIRVKELVSSEELQSFTIIIDALFGTGLSREIKGIYLEFIKRINDSGCFVISADVPSGISLDEGIPRPLAVRADLTVCFGRPKVSLFSEPGFEYAGEVISDDISIPDEAYGDFNFFTADIGFVRKIYTKRKRTGFKGNYGKIFIIAGSPGMTGAAGLCAEACFRSGAGLVYTAVPESRIYEYESLLRESISIPIADNKMEYLSNISAAEIAEASRDKTAVVIGPGLHEKSNSHEIFKAVALTTNIPIIIDARTLGDLASNPGLLDLARGRTIITPHPGEMAKLIGVSTKEIQKSRIKSSMEFAGKYKTIVLLKGHKTIVTDGHRVYLNTTGNPGMATAGSGDVLCGVIAAALSYAPSLIEAVAAGAFVHGMAGDTAALKLGEYGMKSGDIITELPFVLKKITGEN